jgi:hypothetical protein
MAATLDEIRRRGLGALRRELGRAGMIRFLQQFDRGAGDYAKERHAWVDRMSLDALVGTTRKKASAKRQAGLKQNGRARKRR